MAEPVCRGIDMDALRRQKIAASFYRFGDHLAGGACVIRVVAVHQDVNFRFDIRKHAANDIAFPLAHFRSHNRAGGPGPCNCLVFGIVVVDVNFCVWQRGFKIANDRDNRSFFIVAGHQHGDTDIGMGGLMVRNFRHSAISPFPICRTFRCGC